MQQLATRTHLLQSGQIAAFVVDAGQTIADKLFGDVGQPVAIALQLLLFGKRFALADFVEYASRAVGDAAVQFAVFVAVVGSAGRIGRVLGDTRHLQGLAVVVRGVAAAMMHQDRVILRNLIQVVNVELAIILHLGVVEEISVDPIARGRLLRFGAEFVDDAGDGDKLDFEGIADDDVVEQSVAARMIVTIDEPGHDGHLLGVERLGPLADERLNVLIAPYGDEPANLDRECLRLRRAGIDRVDLGVEDDEIGVLRLGIGGLCLDEPAAPSNVPPAIPAMPAPVRLRNSLRLWRFFFIAGSL